MDTRTLDPESPLSYDCGYCHVKVGEGCVGPSGKPRPGGVHSVRGRLAEDAFWCRNAQEARDRETAQEIVAASPLTTVIPQLMSESARNVLAWAVYNPVSARKVVEEGILDLSDSDMLSMAALLGQIERRAAENAGIDPKLVREARRSAWGAARTEVDPSWTA